VLKIHRIILKEFKTLEKDGARIIVFGSVARGDYHPGSDMDIAIVSKNPDVRKRAEEIANRVLENYGIAVSLKFFDELKGRTPFEQEIMEAISHA